MVCTVCTVCRSAAHASAHCPTARLMGYRPEVAEASARTDAAFARLATRDAEIRAAFARLGVK